MAITAARWSDLGYRRAAALPLSTGTLSADKIAGFFENYGYRREAACWVRLRGRGAQEPAPSLVRLAGVITAQTRAAPASYSWVAPFLASQYGQAARGHLPQAKLETCANLVRTLADAQTPRFTSMVNVGKAIGFVPPAQLEGFLRDIVLPTFFGAFPEGRVAVVVTDAKCEAQAGVLRGLYSMSYTEPADLSKVGGFPVLRHWQEVSGHSTVRLGLELFGYLTYPAITTYRCGTLGLDFVFMFSPAEEHRLPVYPADWLALLRSRSAFGEEDRDGLGAIVDPAGDEAVAVAHRRRVHRQRFAVADVETFLRWWISRLDSFLVELLDPANFTEKHDPEGTIDGVSAFENHITMSRLLKRMAACMSVAEGSHAKTVTFEIADLLDGLMVRNQNTGDTEHFKHLFHPTSGLALVRAGLAGVPAPFGPYLDGLACQVYAELRASVLDSIWVPGKRGGGVVLVKSKQLTAEVPIAEDDFVAAAMRAYRNGHHGYFTAEDGSRRPSRFLYMLDGNTPDSLGELAVLWLLSLLADPSGMAGARSLGFGGFA